MSDTYSTDELPDPVDFAQRRATTLANQGNQDDPEKAARAIKLSQATGAPASVIYSTLDEFDAQFRNTASGEIIKGNPHLQQYINNTPLAAKLSNDDWANLDEISNRLERVDNRKLPPNIGPPGQSVMGKFIEGFAAGWGDERLGAWTLDPKYESYFGNQSWKLNRAIHSVIGAPVEAFVRAGSGVVHGAQSATEEGAKLLGADPSTAQRIGREAGSMVEWAMGRGDINLGHGMVAPAREALRKELKPLEPWLRQGEEPPVGVHPVIDEVKAEQAKVDADNLKELTTEAQKSTTRERDPDTFAAFIRAKTDAQIHIPAEVVRKVYGDKLPTPDDGLLGWVPRLDDQLKLSELGGGDVAIPLADWLAKVDPKVSKELHDFIRVRKGGMTLEETKVPEQPPQPALSTGDEAVSAVRQSGGLEPVFDLERQRKLKLQASEAAVDDPSFRNYDLVDAEGKPQATLIISINPKNSKVPVVEWMSGAGEIGERDITNQLGPRVIRDLLAQLKQEFPEATHLDMYRAGGARWGKAAKRKMDEIKPTDSVRIALEAVSDADIETFLKKMREIRDKPIPQGEWKQQGLGVQSFAPETLTPEQTKLVEETKALIARVGGKEVRQEPATSIMRTTDTGVIGAKGMYMEYTDKKPLILWAMDTAQTTARHEALHHLYRQGFFTEGEWTTLERAARKYQWRSIYDIDKRYGDNADFKYKLEEAIVHAYADWGAGKVKVDGPVAAIFEKIKSFLAELRDKVKDLFGKDLTAEQLFARIERGGIAERGRMSEPKTEGAFRTAAEEEPTSKMKQLDMAEMTRMEDREVFARAQAVGMTKQQYERMMKLIEKRDAEDVKAQAQAAEAAERRRQTAEWKANRAAMVKTVEDDLTNRPDIAADRFFRTGEYGGEKLRPRPKLDPEFLSPEDRASLPKEWIGEGGLHPDDAASMFGYPSGQELIGRLAQWSAERKQTGLGPKPFFDRVVDAEVDRRMEAQYGDLEKNILEEAKDHVLSQTQLDLLHEETLYFAEKAGLQLALPKKDIHNSVVREFQGIPLKDAVSADYLAAMQRVEKKRFDAMSKQDWAEAFRLSQQKEYAMVMAREAKRVEKEKVQVERLAGRYSGRKVPGVDEAHADYVQGLLKQANYKVRLTPEEIKASMDFHGYKTLDDLVTHDRGFGWEPEVSETILAGGTKPVEQMTVGEFREFKDAIDSLNHIGREIKKIDLLGEAMDFDAFKTKVITNLKKLPLRPREKQGRWTYALDASLTRMEELVKDFDLRQELGPVYNAVIVPMMQSKAKEFDMITELSNYFKTLDTGRKEWRKTLRDAVPQNFIIDPQTGTPYKMDREMLLQIMLNWGNRSNIDKFAKGYASLEKGAPATAAEAQMFEMKVKDLIDRHATKEDWDWVQAMWQPFKKWQKEADVVSRNVSGVAPKWIAPDMVDTPHGQFEGGYWPVKYDRYGSNLAVIEDMPINPNAPLGPNYFRAATAKGHLKERTGYIDAVDINTSLEQAAGVMQQMIHDIAFRDAVVQTSKVFYDKQIRSAIRNYYGMEYEKQLVPWLRRVANAYSANDQSLAFYNDWMRRVRVNLIGHALPLNLKVILSPDVGMPNPKTWLEFEANRSANKDLAMAHSNEIRHMVYNIDRDFRERLEQVVAKRGWSKFQQKSVEWAFQPMMKVSQEFRMSTFVEQFNRAKAEGRTDFEAAQIADSHVRERHGAAHVADLPAIMTSNEFVKQATMFYGYFNSMYNWQRQLPQQLRQGQIKKAVGTFSGSVLVGAAFGAALFNQAKKDEPWWWTVGKALALQPLSTVPLVREAASLFMEGRPAQTPTESLTQAVRILANDINRKTKGQPMQKPVQNTMNIIGMSTGLGGALQMGKTGQFFYDVAQGKQRPRDFWQWTRGIIHGEAVPKR